MQRWHASGPAQSLSAPSFTDPASMTPTEGCGWSGQQGSRIGQVMGEYLSGFEPDREVQSRMGGPCESQLDQVSGELSPAAQPRSKGEVLIIAYYFPPQNTAGAARPSRFHKYLPEFGYRTQVISAAAPAGDSSWRDVRRTSQAGGILASGGGQLRGPCGAALLKAIQ